MKNGVVNMKNGVVNMKNGVVNMKNVMVLVCFIVFVMSCSSSLRPTGPGEGEPTVIIPDPGDENRPSEIGSFWIQSEQLNVTFGSLICNPEDPSECKVLDACAESVNTRICDFESPTSDPKNCKTLVWNRNQTLRERGNLGYKGVELVEGACIEAVRSPNPPNPNNWYWRFMGNHPKAGTAEDMSKGGGSPQPGVWTTVPVTK